VAWPLLLDTHCHVDRFANVTQLLRAAADAGVTTVAVTELPSAFQRLSMLLSGRKDVRVALGLHPLRAREASALELRLFDRLVTQTQWVGEVGLDFSRVGASTRQRQLQVFEHVLACDNLHEKVLSVHSRGAEEETVDMLAAAQAIAVLHWYSGPLGPLDDALASGLYFSINPAMLASKRGMRIVAALPLDRVLIETDGPHTKVDGRPAEPSHVPRIARDLAGAWGSPPDEVLERIRDNASRLLERTLGDDPGERPAGQRVDVHQPKKPTREAVTAVSVSQRDAVAQLPLEP
jgi:TatD DNase family protein